MKTVEQIEAEIASLNGRIVAVESRHMELLTTTPRTVEQDAECNRLADESKALTAQFQDLHDAKKIAEGQIRRGHELRLAKAEAETQRVAATARQHEAELAAERQRRQELAGGRGRLVLPDKPGAGRTPDAPHTATDEEARVTAYFEETDETVTLNFGHAANAQQRTTYREQCKANVRTLKTAGYKPWGEFKSPQEFIREGLQGAGTEKFGSKLDRHYMAVTGMSEGVGSDGGYLLMPEFNRRIIDRVYRNDLWSRTDNYTVTGNAMTFVANAETSRATGSRHGGLRGYWLPEGGTKTPSFPTLRSITLKLVKLAVVVYLTDELLDDTGTVLSDYVVKKVSEEINFMIGDALINGNGVGMPLGVLNWPSLVSVAIEQGQLADTLETENIVNMWSRFYAPNRDKMIWLHNQDVERELLTMTLGVGTGGVVTYMPPGGLSSAPYATILGKPSMATEFNPTLGDQGDILAWDPSMMLSISKGGIAQAVSMHVAFLTDQTALRFVMRLNAGPWESAPLTPFKGTNTLSSAVVLDAR